MLHKRTEYKFNVIDGSRMLIKNSNWYRLRYNSNTFEIPLKSDISILIRFTFRTTCSLTVNAYFER